MSSKNIKNPRDFYSIFKKNLSALIPNAMVIIAVKILMDCKGIILAKSDTAPKKLQYCKCFLTWY